MRNKEELYKELDALTCDQETQDKNQEKIQQVCHELVGVLMSKNEESVSNEDLRKAYGCDLFKGCIEDCQSCLWNTLSEKPKSDDYQFWDIDNDIAYNFDNQKDDDEEFNY